jgi:hypothetical protein
LIEPCFTQRLDYRLGMIAETIPGLRSLSSDQKILLAAELWRDAVGAPGGDPNSALA